MEVLIKKGGPSAIRMAVGMLIAAIVAHQGMLQKFGIFYDAANHIISVHLNSLSDALDLALLGSIGAIVKIINHHAATVLAPAQAEPAQK